MSHSPTHLARALSLAALTLVIAGLMSVGASHLSFSNPWLVQIQKSFIRLFDLDREGNVPTWFSSSLLLAAAGLLAFIATRKKGTADVYYRHWLTLAVVFLYLSIDEAAVIHEMAIKPMHDVLPTHGYLYYGWIIPAGACVAVFAIAYLRFLIHLSVRTRILFVVAGAIYVGGALGIEAITGRFAEFNQEGGLSYQLLAVLEESCEMAGVILFIYALLCYVRDNLGIAAACRSDVRDATAGH